jgi:signal transduction histidine kinase
MAVKAAYSHFVWSPRPRRLASRPWSDILVAIGLFAWAAPDVPWWWRPRGHVPSTPVVLGYLALALAMSVPFLWRRRYPVVVLLFAVAVLTTRLALSVDSTAAFVAVLVGAYGLASYSVSARRYARWAGWLCLPAAVVVAAVSNGHRMNGAPVAMLGAALLVGDAATARRNELAAAVEAAHLAERTRIARELHDVLAHQLSAIAVQAGASRMAGPDGAAATLATVEQLSREALGELSHLLGMLRTDAGDHPARRPAPTLAELDALLAATRAAGVSVDLAVDGPVRDLSPAVQLAAYRIIQESLINVARHAPGAAALVAMRYTDTHLRVDVTNEPSLPVPHVPPGSGGRGVLGMRERAQLFGGSLRATERPDGGFEVSAVLPYQNAGELK